MRGGGGSHAMLDFANQTAVQFECLGDLVAQNGFHDIFVCAAVDDDLHRSAQAPAVVDFDVVCWEVSSLGHNLARPVNLRWWHLSHGDLHLDPLV